MSKIILFDIDGTLILTAGAGGRAMSRAFEEVFGIRDGFTGIPMAGRTDLLILADALEAASIPATDDVVSRFRETYLAMLPGELQAPADGKRVLPGVDALIPRLHQRADVFLALLTGNFSEAARLKLDYFGLWDFFRCGAFGEEAHERHRLVPVAMDRARACGAPEVVWQDVLVVGDTPSDIACAASVGARAIAVATGPCDAATLRAAGADVVFDDLGDTEGFLRLLEAG